MYEIDNRKDQVMTVCKVALANLAMWVHDHYFPPSYAQATWKRLLPFFQLPGTITQDATSPSGPLVAFLLRRKWEKYLDSLFIPPRRCFIKEYFRWVAVQLLYRGEFCVYLNVSSRF